MQKAFPKADVRVARNPGQLWAYCQKDESRVLDFPRLTFGDPPRASVSTAGDKKQFNLNLLAMGAVQAFMEGLIKPQDFQRTDACLRTVKAATTPKPPPIAELSNIWYWGPTGTGKSRTARTDFPDFYEKEPN